MEGKRDPKKAGKESHELLERSKKGPRGGGGKE